jgi:biopolymer transport protein ExbB/TolQ
MPLILRQCGFFAWPLLVLSAALLFLVVRAAWRLTRVEAGKPDPALESDLRAIPFWGGMAVLVGFVGQYTGIYHAATAISRAREISPAVVAQGFAESFSSSLYGMTVLLVAALVWFALQARYRKLSGAGGGTVRPEAALALGALLLLLTPAAGGMLMAMVVFPVN